MAAGGYVGAKRHRLQVIAAVTDALRRHYHVIVADPRGHGDSASSASGHYTLVHWIRAWIEQQYVPMRGIKGDTSRVESSTTMSRCARHVV